MSSTPNTTSAKKLVQKRLSFFKAPDKYNTEPPKKKLAFTTSSEDQENKIDNANQIINTSPVKKESERETDDKSGCELLNKEINHCNIIDLTSPIKSQPTIACFVSSVNKKKRNNSDEDVKEIKKLKLDEIVSKAEESKSDCHTALDSLNDNVEIKIDDKKEDGADCSIIEDESLECSPKVDLNSTLDTSCEAMVHSPLVVDSAKKDKPPRKKTAKQIEKGQEAVKKREEKEKLKQEKDLQKQQEKEEKQKLKEEKDLLKKKELEEKEESKRKVKEEKERKKQQEVELKNEEKRRKEEEKKRREDEIQRKKDEDKKRKEEEIQKKKEEEAAQKLKYAKEAAAFSTFFKKIQKTEEETEVNVAETIVFKPFAVKNRMRLAPINRNPMNEDRKKVFDDCIVSQDVYETYLTQLRCGEIKLGRSGKTWPLEEIYQDDDAEVEEIPVEPPSSITAEICGHRSQKVPRAKLLLFNENRRPPYWGTWRKKCAAITSRRPFGIYKEFDYEVDSDEEWEEEEPGESLHGSDDEKEKDDQDGEDDYDIDNDIFVPHGYLSEDEEPADETWSVEQQKEKLKLLGEQFDQERSEKTKQLRPIVLGCIWVGTESYSALTGNTKISALLLKCKPLILDSDLPIQLNNPEEPGSPEDRDLEMASPASTKRGAFPEEAVPALIPRVHGVRRRHRMIAKEFVHTWAQENPDSPMLSMAAVSRKIKEIAQWQECPEPPLLGRQCWFVLKEVREQNGLADLPLRAPEAAFSSKTPANVSALDDSSVSTLSSTPSTPKITKFTRVLTEEERRQSLSKPKPINVSDKDDVVVLKHVDISSPAVPSPMVEKALNKLVQFRAPNATSPPPKKKVAILFSVPRGEPMIKSSEIPVAAKTDSCSEIKEKVEESNKDSGAAESIPVIDLDNESEPEESTGGNVLIVEPMEVTIVS